MSHEIKEVLRLTLNERIQHLVLMVFVLVLMITGLSLRFCRNGIWAGDHRVGRRYGFSRIASPHCLCGLAIVMVFPCVLCDVYGSRPCTIDGDMSQNSGF
jgi:cytochrome b subunit of formate dehydrogenase